MSPIPGNTRTMKPLPKFLLAAILAGGVLFGLKTAAQHGLIPGGSFIASLNPLKANLPDVKEAQASANITPIAFPSSSTAPTKHPVMRFKIWAWNAQAAFLYANGGPLTTKGSLMDKHDVNLVLERQDDTSQMQNDLVACANQLSGGATECSTGTNYVIIMGDGSGQFLAGVNPILAKIGPDYIAEVVGAVGYSRGEDKLMGPIEWKRNPQSMKGAVVAGVPRDGDWDISLKFEGDNTLKNNPDEKTWDPEAVNWVAASDYIKAAEMYNSNYCEDRPVVKNGVPTGDKKNVCVNGVVTWTPGDVNIAHGRGGLVSVVSSKEYRSQMPATIIGIRKFNHDNPEKVAGLLAATFEAGDQLKAFPQTLDKAMEISAAVYTGGHVTRNNKCVNEGEPCYWLKYFKGVKEKDSTGLEVELGGSAVNNLADNLVLFGLQPGSNNNFKSTYNVFGSIVVQQYPKLVPKIPEVKDILNTSYLRRAQDLIESGTAGAAEEFTYTNASNQDADVVSKKSWSITFDTGRATLTPDGIRTVRQLKDELAITGLSIRVDGHTDNSGSDVVNIPLSEARAQAVVTALQQYAPRDFPSSRFSVHGFGATKPIANNGSAAGKAQNRRVDITLVQ